MRIVLFADDTVFHTPIYFTVNIDGVKKQKRKSPPPIKPMAGLDLLSAPYFSTKENKWQPTLWDPSVFTTVENYSFFDSEEDDYGEKRTIGVPYRTGSIATTDDTFYAVLEKIAAVVHYRNPGDHCLILPNPHLVGMLAHLLREKNWEVELATNIYFTTNVLEFAVFSLFYKDICFGGISDAQREKHAELRDIFCPDFFEKTVPHMTGKKERRNFTDIIAEIVKNKFDISDDQIKDVQIMLVSEDKTKLDLFQRWHKGLGAPAYNTIIPQIPHHPMCEDTYGLFYYALHAGYCASVDGRASPEQAQLADLHKALTSPEGRIQKYYLPEMITEFERRVLGLRYFGNPANALGKLNLGTRLAVPAEISAKGFPVAAIASSDSSRLAISYGKELNLYYLYKSGSPIERIQWPKGSASFMAFSPFGNVLYVSNGVQLFRIDLKQPKAIPEALPIKMPLNIVNLHVDDKNGLHFHCVKKGGIASASTAQLCYLPYPYTRVLHPYGEPAKLALISKQPHQQFTSACFSLITSSDAKVLCTMHAILGRKPSGKTEPHIAELYITDLEYKHSKKVPLSDVRTKFECNNPYAANVVNFVEYNPVFNQFGFLLAFVNVDNSLAIYRYYLNDSIKDAAHDGGAWTIEKFDKRELKGRVTAIEFAPNGACLMIATEEDARKGNMYTITIPSIEQNKKGMKLAMSCQQITFGQVEHLVPVSTADRRSWRTLMVPAKLTSEIPYSDPGKS